MNKLLLAVAILASIVLSTEVFGFNIHGTYFSRQPKIYSRLENVSSRALELDYIEQRVDNFNPQNTDTYRMRYYRNDEFFQEGGPIFIDVGGSWSIYPGALIGGHMHDMAKELNGAMFTTEHRYYGESVPTPDASTENLQYLTVEQALADLANFISVTKQEPRFQNSNVVLVGGWYGGTMAAWFRQLYPHLAVGAWASGAPVLAKADNSEYMEVVGAAYRSIGGYHCYDRITNAFAEAQTLIYNGDGQRFQALFGICGGFDAEVDAAAAFSLITDEMGFMVQAHEPGWIESVCEEINATVRDTDLEAFASWYSYRFSTSLRCIRTFNGFIQYHRDTAWNTASTYGGRQWLYQTCTEFGWYKTSGSVYQPFGRFPVRLFYKMCSGLFGEQINGQTIHLNIEQKNVLYGGLRPEVNNVYFTNGMIDPWRPLSIQTDLNSRSPADVIPGASHCAELRSASPYDSVEMAAVKQRVKYLVRLWLGLAY